jgi:hypothetical protein
VARRRDADRAHRFAEHSRETFDTLLAEMEDRWR